MQNLVSKMWVNCVEGGSF